MAESLSFSDEDDNDSTTDPSAKSDPDSTYGINHRKSTGLNEDKDNHESSDIFSEKDLSNKTNHNSSTPKLNLAKTEKKAKKLSLQQKNEDALKEFIKCMAFSRIAFGDEDWIVAKYHVILATAYLDLKDYAVQAVHHCMVADDILTNLKSNGKHPKESSEVLKVLIEKEHSKVRAQMALKKFSEAENSLAEAKQLFDALSKHEDSASEAVRIWELKLTMAYGRLFMLMKKWELSTKYFEKAKELEIESNGKHSSNLIAIYQNLGKIEQSKQPADHEKAVGYYLQAHSIAISNFSPKSLEVAKTSHMTALAFANICEHDAENSAEAYLKESLGIYRCVNGVAHEKTLEVLDELARLYVRTERIMDGIKLMESSVPLKEEQYNYYSKKMATTFKLIASGYMSLGSMEKAWKNFEKCHAIECVIFGSSHKFVESTKKTMDILLQNPVVSSKLKKVSPKKN